MLPGFIEAAEISGPNVRFAEGDIFVSTNLLPDEAQMNDISHGISKEITFYLDLFRVWNNWPDEFVTGRVITKTLKCDPVKKEYIATSFDGATLIKKRFSGCRPLTEWAFNINELKLTNVKELEPADYFVKVTVESRMVRLPPVISFLFFFVPEKEFTISKNSKTFRPGDAR